ncbi:MAG: type II secretion system F family protein [Candidatus Nanopelagicales bacterium]
MSAVGALIGLAVGGAVALLGAGLLAHRPLRLVDRLRGAHRQVTEQGPLHALRQILGSPFLRMVSRDGSDLTARLRRAGREGDADAYRLERLVWCAGGVGVGAVIALLLALRSGTVSGGAIVALAVVGAVGGWLAHDRQLARVTRSRATRMSDQLPTVAELVAFAVAAGEGPLAALDRVATTVRGDLAGEFSLAVRRVRGGAPFPTALREMAEAVPSLEASRFADGIAVATERGTPMADVLRAQAADARASGRRRLLEKAGKKEVLMLVPVVFFILPIVVIIALYPGIHGLQLTVS